MNMNIKPNYLDFCTRIAVFLMALVICAVLLITGARHAQAATLKPAVVLSGSVLTLGDIFDGLDQAKASFVLGPAPQPGTDMVLNARTLMRVALATDLQWRPAGVMDQIIITREVTVIDTDTIKTELERALRAQGMEGRFTVSFRGQINDLVLPGDTPETLEIVNMRFDRQTDYFNAVVAAPSADNPVTRIEVSGRVDRTISVPVLGRTLRSGDIIGAADLDWIDMPERSLQHDIILDESVLIGMTPRRMITTGKPVRDIEVIMPQLVSRGDTVTIVYENGPILLTSSGRALQHGAKGDMIRIANSSSNRSIEATVSGEREVRVTAH